MFVFRYHLGTLAFGSLIVAIVQIIRVILEYIDQKLKGADNAAAKFFIKCVLLFVFLHVLKACSLKIHCNNMYICASVLADV